MAGLLVRPLPFYNYYSINLVGFYKLAPVNRLFKLINCTYEPKILDGHPDREFCTDGYNG